MVPEGVLTDSTCVPVLLLWPLRFAGWCPKKKWPGVDERIRGRQQKVNIVLPRPAGFAWSPGRASKKSNV